jgi:hypothetical protein
LFDYKFFQNYLKIETDEIKEILLDLKERINDSSVTIIDSIKKRLIGLRDNPKIVFLLTKLLSIKDRIVAYCDEDDINELWLSLKLLDSISLDIYNEYKVNSVFKKLDGIYYILDEYLDKDKKENILISFIKSNDFK